MSKVQLNKAPLLWSALLSMFCYYNTVLSKLNYFFSNYCLHVPQIYGRTGSCTIRPRKRVCIMFVFNRRHHNVMTVTALKCSFRAARCPLLQWFSPSCPNAEWILFCIHLHSSVDVIHIRTAFCHLKLQHVVKHTVAVLHFCFHSKYYSDEVWVSVCYLLIST